MQRKQLPGLRVQYLLPIKVLIVRARRLRGQGAVRSFKATGHLPINHYVSVSNMPLFWFPFEGAPDVLEGVCSLEGVEDPVVVPAERTLEGFALGSRHRPRRAAADSSRSTAVVRHDGL